jgi:prepilin-type processing-associated H-X9-DG protein
MMTLSHPPVSEPLSTRSNQNPQSGAGFSQVDLLAVIVVVVLLGLLLRPALARTRATDQVLQCRDNLRQLIHGWRLYADDNGGKLPDCFDWVYGYENYTANNPDNTNINYLIHGMLGPYVTNPAVYKCPADMSTALMGTVRLPRVRTYSMSQAFALPGEGLISSPPYRHYMKSADMVSPPPAKLWVLLEESPDTVNDGAFAVRMDPYGATWQDIPAILHEGGSGFAFADGHYELKKWTDPRTLALKVTYSSGNYGISQPNNPDIKWLQDRTTAPK